MSLPRRGEEGSALVIALVFLSVFSAWVATTLTSAQNAFKVSQSLASGRPGVYAVDAAMEQAVQVIRKDANKGKEGVSNCDSDLTLNGTPVHVTCTAQAGSGHVGVGGSSPTLGVLTLATAPEIGYQQNSNSTVRINGGLYSNSPMTQWGGSASRLNACPPSFPTSGCTVHDAYGTVTAVGPCSSGRIIAEILNCNAAATPAGADPNYTADQTTFSAVTPVPARTSVCPSGYALVDMKPGWYNDAVGLSALTSGTSCPHSIIWFEPGSYYFDFKNNPTTTPTACSSTATCTWTIDDQTATVVGGQPTWPVRSFTDSATASGSTTLTSTTSQAAFTSADVGAKVYGTNIPPDTRITGVNTAANPKTATISHATTGSLSGQTVSIATLPADPGTLGIPGRCNADTLNNHPGVEFIWGGLARLNVAMGAFEICSPVALLAQQIAFYGVKADTGTLKAETGCITAVGFVSPGDSTHCPLVQTGGNKAFLVINGTAYAPNAVFEMKMNNVTYQTITRGIIARVLGMHITPSSDFGGAFISSPGLGTLTANDREVFLTAFTDWDPVHATGTQRLRALVNFHDTPTTGYSIIVRSWSVVR